MYSYKFFPTSLHLGHLLGFFTVHLEYCTFHFQNSMQMQNREIKNSVREINGTSICCNVSTQTFESFCAKFITCENFTMYSNKKEELIPSFYQCSILFMYNNSYKFFFDLFYIQNLTTPLKYTDCCPIAWTYCKHTELTHDYTIGCDHRTLQRHLDMSFYNFYNSDEEIYWTR